MDRTIEAQPTPAPQPPAQAPPPPDLEPIHPGSGRNEGLLKRFGGVAAAIGLLLVKFGAKLKVLLFALPKLKLFTTSASMLVSIVAYQLIFGWPFAVGFVLLLLLHEMGHVIQLRREGVEASAPMFIPFLGAVISAKSLGKDAAAEARVGLAGPILGTIATLIPLGLWLATGEDFWRALAYIGFFLNLFNLLPVVPLDGGRAMAALSPWVWFAGFAATDRPHLLLPEPDHAAGAAVRRTRELAALEGAEDARGPRLPRHPDAHARVRRRHLPAAGGPARGRRRRNLLRARPERRLGPGAPAPSADAEPGGDLAQELGGDPRNAGKVVDRVEAALALAVGDQPGRLGRREAEVAKLVEVRPVEVDGFA